MLWLPCGMLRGAGMGAALLAHPCFLRGQEEFHHRAGLSRGLCSCLGSRGGLSLSACYQGRVGCVGAKPSPPGVGGLLLAVTKAHVRRVGGEGSSFEASGAAEVGVQEGKSMFLWGAWK